MKQQLKYKITQHLDIIGDLNLLNIKKDGIRFKEMYIPNESDHGQYALEISTIVDFKNDLADADKKIRKIFERFNLFSTYVTKNPSGPCG